MAQNRERQAQEVSLTMSSEPRYEEVFDAVAGRWIPLDDRARRAIVPGEPLADAEVKALAFRNQLREQAQSNSTLVSSQPSREGEPHTGPWAQLNRGLISGLVLGEPASKELLTQGAQYLNVPVATTDPQGFHERGLRYAGMAGGAVPGLYSIAKMPVVAAAARARPVARTLLSMLTKPFQQPTGKAIGALGAEMSAGYGAGVGEEIGKDTLLEPFTTMLGAIVPGVASSFARMLPSVTAARILRQEQGRIRDLIDQGPEAISRQVAEKSKVLSDIAEDELGGVARPAVTTKCAFDPSSLAGQKIQRVMQRQIGDPDSPQVEQIIKSLDEPRLPGAESVAQRTRHPLLIDLERRQIAGKGRTASEAWDAEQRREQRKLVEQVEGRGTVEDARLQSAQALEEAAEAVAEPVEQLSRTDIATRLSDNLVQSKRNAKIREQEIWIEADKASGDLKFPTAPLIKKWTGILSGIEKAKLRDIPPVVLRLIPEHARTKEVQQLLLEFGETPAAVTPDWPRTSAFGADESPREIQGAVSALKELKRLNPGTNLGRIANELARSADKFLERELLALQKDSPAYLALIKARAFTKNLHQSFDQNPKIAKMTQGAEGREELAINPELVFEKLGFSTGPGMVTSTNANTLRQVLDASSFEPPAPVTGVTTGRAPNQDAIDSVNDFLMQRFIEKTSGGENFPQIQQFIRAHRDLWNANRFPELQELSNSLSSLSKLAERAQAVDELEGSVRKVLKAQNPLRIFQSMEKMKPRGSARLSPDSDRALWRTALLRGVMRDGKTGELLIGTGRQRGAGASLLSALDNPRTGPVFRRVFSKYEIKNLRTLARGMESRERSIIYDPTTGQRIQGVSESVNLAEGDPMTDVATAAITRGSRLIGAYGSNIWPLSMIRGGASLTVAGTTASAGQNVAVNVLKNNHEMAIQEIIKNEQNVRDVLTKVGDLDKPTMGRLRALGKKLWNWLGWPDLGEAIPAATRQALVPVAKTQLGEEDPTRPIYYGPE